MIILQNFVMLNYKNGKVVCVNSDDNMKTFAPNKK